MRRARRRFSAAALAAALIVPVVLAPSAHANLTSVALYSQFNDTATYGSVARGTQTVILTISPTSTVGSTPVTIVVSSTLAMTNDSGAAMPALGAELDAVVRFNSVDYTLRGPQNSVAVASGAALFQGGWVVSSTTGGSSGLSAGGFAATTGDGAHFRNLETVLPQNIVVTGVPGTYPVALKAIITNRITGTSTPALTDLADQITNTDATNAGAGPGTVGPGGPTGSLATNSGTGLTATNGNVVFAPQAAVTVLGANATIATSTGQNAAVQALRQPMGTWSPPTATMTLSGSAWGANIAVGGFTVQFCTTAGASCDAAPLPAAGTITNTLSTNASGVLSGSIVLSRGGCSTSCFTQMVTTGNRAIKLVQGANNTLVPLLVLANATVSITPAVGGPGTVVQVSGSNFNPSQSVSINGYTGACSAACAVSSDATVTATADAIGGLPSTAFTINDATTIGIVGHQASFGAPSASNPFGTTAFTVLKDKCTADAGNVNTGNCNTSQQVYSTILAGNLSQAAAASPGNPNDTSIVFCQTAAPITPPGGVQPGNIAGCGMPVQTANTKMYGTLNPVTVTDNRGGTFGWSLTATLPNLSDGTHSIVNTNVAITPTCTSVNAGSAPGAVSGSALQNFSGTVSLCVKDTQIAAAPGSQTSGGQWQVTAPLTVNVPAFQAAGQYNSTLTINLS